MDRRVFYWRCLKRACRGGYGWASGASLLATVVCGFLASQHHEWGDSLTLWLWAVPLAVFLATAIVAWNLAPHAMYRELEQSITDSAVSADPAEYSWRRAELGDVKEIIHDLYMQMPKGDAVRDWSGFMSWYWATIARLKEILRTIKWQQFANNAQPYIGGSFATQPDKAPIAFSVCAQWLDRARSEVRPDEISPDFQIKCKLPAA
jgi:hypothetical protein